MPDGKLDIELLGRRLAAVRALRGLNQKQVADEIGVSQVSYSKYEHGKITMGLDKLVAICAMLDVSPGWLLGLDDSRGMGPM